jgi:hypothetical protein
MALPLAVSIAVFLAVQPFMGANGTGSGIMIFSSLRNSSFYPAALGLTPAEQEFGGGLLPMSLLTYLGLITFSVIMLGYLISYAWLWAGLPALRRDAGHEGGWVLLGIGFAGFAAMMIIDQDGSSQVYFFKIGLIGWYFLAAWGLHLLTKRIQSPLGAVAVGGLVGVFALFVLRALIPNFTSPERPLWTLAVVGAVALLLLMTVLLPWKFARSAAWRNTVLVSAATAAIAGALILPVTSLKVAPTPETTTWAVSSEEFQAADWLRQHSDPNEVVATNVHCWFAPSDDRCNSRAFWVSGFTQRPVLLEGWAYTDAAHEAHGINGLSFSLQPFHDADLFELNEAAFVDPSTETMDALKEQDVKWLFAAKQRSDVAGNVGDYATEVYSNDDVTVYRLD